MDAVDSVVDPLREFAKDSIRLVKRCHKPDRKGNCRAPDPRPRYVAGCEISPDLMGWL
jgi:hypothetical protein